MMVIYYVTIVGAFCKEIFGVSYGTLNIAVTRYSVVVTNLLIGHFQNIKYSA